MASKNHWSSCVGGFLLAFVVSVSAGAGELEKFFANLPEGADPGTISRRITDQFLSTRPENYFPAGYHGNKGYGWAHHVQYSVVSLWVNAIACARLDNDKARETKLIRLFDDFLDGGVKEYCRSRPYHVDDTIFGALPYEIYLANRDERCLKLGNFYADTQWTPPCEGTLKERHMPPKEVQDGYWAKGYTPQTRLWIDDMYMITVLQSQAYRATGERKYIDRAAREMCLYLDELQLKDGKAEGLFYHAPDVPYVWGRGDGWMAAGMALVLDRLPEDSCYRARILKGYHAMMARLLKFQRADGLWCQLVDRPDDPDNWPETSCTAMFAYSFAVGVRRGWLDAEKYGPAVRRAYLALVDRMDAFANVADVCEGTGKKNNLPYYYARRRVNGDPHGQAPMLWLCSEMLADGAGVIRGIRSPATSKLFTKRIDPVSGVVSWALSHGVEENVQSIYFTAKSMTADGRFLIVDLSRNERRAQMAAMKAKKKADAPKKRKALVDFLKDELIELPGIGGQIPFVEVKDDYVVYFRDLTFYRRDFTNPTVEKRLCAYPPELLKDGTRLGYPFTHLTLTRDRSKAFIESRLITRNNETNYVQGTVELATGKWESWGTTDFFCNHGQINPVNDRLAMCAWEWCFRSPEGRAYKKKTGIYPRMWLVYPDGKRQLIPARTKNYASHEIWDDDGDGFSWCGGGVYHYDLATGKETCWVPIPGTTHNMASADEKYVVYDASPEGWWRGCKWAVRFYNRETQRLVDVYSTRPMLMPRDNESRLHPDPHPHFSGNGQWVISTACNARGNMEVYLTAVDQLVARTTMAEPEGKLVTVENPLAVKRTATAEVPWKDLGIRPGDPALRVWDVAANVPVAWQDDLKGKLIFALDLAPGETRRYRIVRNAALPQADLSIVCWSQHLAERMDDFAWENDRFGARAYGPAIMEPAPKGQSLVSSGIDIINKAVRYRVLERWFVWRAGEASYHKDHGEGMDNYKVAASRGCGALGAVDTKGRWEYSRNWKSAKCLSVGPVRTTFELVYPAWGGRGEEKRVVSLDRGSNFARMSATFKGKAAKGVSVGPGLDCAAVRQHNGQVVRDLENATIANFEPPETDGKGSGTIMTGIILDPTMGKALSVKDEMDCEYLIPEKADGALVWWAGADWSGAGRFTKAAEWHARVKDFAAALRAPVKVTVE